MKIELVRVYTKDLSFENPLAPGIFGQEWVPEVAMRLHAGGSRRDGNLLEATLQVHVEARLEGRPAMVIEVVTAGLFAIGEVEGEELSRAIGVTCPTILYPYAGETINSLSVRGGFPPFLMQPADFEELYRRQTDAASEEAADETVD